MSCERVQAELAAFQFGAVDAPTRSLIETHLGACSECLREYFALKHAVETGEGEPAPSPASRARLRSAVAVELGIAPRSPASRARAWSWWERPLAVAVAAAALMAAMGATRVVATARGEPPHAETRGELRAPR